MPAASDILQFMRGQLFQTPQLPKVDFTGKTVIVTGANSGLGFECAKHLFNLNVSTLILGCRNLTKGEAAKKAIVGDRAGAERILVWKLDMAGYNITTLPQGQMLSSLSDEKLADMNGRCFLSKLLVQLCVRKLAARTPISERPVGVPSVIINCPSPGWCKTPLFRQDDGGAIGRNMLRLIGRTGEVRARTLVTAITAGPETHGEYLSESQVKNASVWVRSVEGKRFRRRFGVS
ncbi:hypothetical protein Q7P35_007738 [Cladosporium inversicolor]